MAIEVITGDCLRVMPTLPRESFHAIVTDPPYGLSFMGKEWDRGVPGVDFWRAALDVALPGAVLVAFGGTRTFHRLTCAIEDAGWDIRDGLCWLYGSGFPKSHNLDGEWSGWGTALKPAWEPIILARKPLAGTVAANVQAHGCGALNIDASRITSSGIHACRCGGNTSCNGPSLASVPQSRTRNTSLLGESGGRPAPHTRLRASEAPYVGRDQSPRGSLGDCPTCHHCGGVRSRCTAADGPAPTRLSGDAHELHGRSRTQRDTPLNQSTPCGKCMNIGLQGQGRWPANVVLDEDAARMLDEQAGNLSPSPPASRPIRRGVRGDNIYGVQPNAEGTIGAGYGDSGGASRFFYTAKASKAERDAGLEEMPAVHRVNGNKWTDQDYRVARGERPPSAESGPRRNIHPTVKPLDLMRWLCRLVTPPGGLILDPFCGSGTTGKAAMMEGFGFTGIELNADYADIARKRIVDAAPLFASEVCA